MTASFGGASLYFPKGSDDSEFIGAVLNGEYIVKKWVPSAPSTNTKENYWIAVSKQWELVGVKTPKDRTSSLLRMQPNEIEIINHENLMKIHFVGSIAGPYPCSDGKRKIGKKGQELVIAVVELCTKLELFSYCEREPFSVDLGKHYFVQLVNGFLASYQQKHSINKPKNMLLSKGLVLKLGEFGAARNIRLFAEKSFHHKVSSSSPSKAAKSPRSSTQQTPGKKDTTATTTATKSTTKSCTAAAMMMTSPSSSQMSSIRELALENDQKVQDVWTLGYCLFMFLTGVAPFESENPKVINRSGLFQLLEKSEGRSNPARHRRYWNCEHPLKGGKSPDTLRRQYLDDDVCDLLNQMWDRNLQCRIKMEDILEHHWVNQNTDGSDFIRYNMKGEIMKVCQGGRVERGSILEEMCGKFPDDQVIIMVKKANGF